MSNTITAALYIPFCIMSGILLFSVVTHCRSYQSFRHLLVFFLLLFCWQAAEITYFFVNDTFWLEGIFYVKTILFGFVPAGLFFVVLPYYRIVSKIPRWLYLAVYTVPLVSVGMAVSSPWHTYIADVHDLYMSGGVYRLSIDYGFWYYVMLIYAIALYALLLIGIIVLFSRLPKAYRSGSLFHLLSLTGVMACVFMEHALFVGQSAIGFVYVGITGSALAVYLAIHSTGKSNVVQIDKSEIFNYLDESIFILNERKLIVEANRPAQLWLKSLGRRLEEITFKGLLAVLTNNKWISYRQNDDDPGVDIYFLKSSFPMIYRMDRHKFEEVDGNPVEGEFVTITDVTRNRLMIERLRDMAGIDALTGLANRFRYQDVLRQMDRRENYPLTIIIGDANGLKMINDTYGHKMGDLLLKNIAGVLQEFCPKDGLVARYGGDEFAVLLPSCTQEKAAYFIEDVYMKLQTIHSLPIIPSIALGSATKHHGNENLNALITQADKKMYDDKVLLKKKEKEEQEALEAKEAEAARQT